MLRKNRLPINTNRKRRISLKNVAWGFLLWLVATLLFRFWGHLFLIPEHKPLLFVTFLMGIPLITAATYPYYYFMKIPGHKLTLTAIQIAVPGMFLDIFSMIFFSNVFPNLHNDSLPYFAAWLLWAYSLILITGIPLKRKRV